MFVLLSRNGAGRSGTLISIYNSTERLKVEQLIDIPQCVRAIRTVVPNAIGVVVSVNSNVIRQRRFYDIHRNFLKAGLPLKEPNLNAFWGFH